MVQMSTREQGKIELVAEEEEGAEAHVIPVARLDIFGGTLSVLIPH